VVERCLADVDVAVHLAAVVSVPFSVENPDVTFGVNVGGTLNVLRSCVNWRVKKLVFASSCAVYGEPESLPVTEKTAVKPISPYAESKLAGEQYCCGFSDVRLMSTVAFRFFNVYGSRQGANEYAGVITKFVDWGRRSLPLVIYGDGLQTRDFVNVKDVVSAILFSMERSEADGKVVNVGSGEPTTINDLAKTVLDLCGSDKKVVYEDAREGDIKHSYADTRLAKQVLGYKPEVSLRDGLAELLSHYSVVCE
jgi:UDP-glucose 4-epimerase